MIVLNGGVPVVLIDEPKLTPDKDGMKDSDPPGAIVCGKTHWKARPARSPGVVLKVVFVQVELPTLGGQLAFAATTTTLPIELTQA